MRCHASLTRVELPDHRVGHSDRATHGLDLVITVEDVGIEPRGAVLHGPRLARFPDLRQRRQPRSEPVQPATTRIKLQQSAKRVLRTNRAFPTRAPDS